MKEIETLKNVKDCVGKTISGCVFSITDREMLLKFTDGTVLVIESIASWEDTEINRDGGELHIRYYREHDLLEAGIVDQEYIDGWKRKQAAAEAEHKNQIEFQERMEYMRLKKKFENE